MVTVNITKKLNKGWGKFIQNPHRHVHRHLCELITDAEEEERGIKYESGRTCLFDLDFHHLKSRTKYVVDAYHAGKVSRFVIVTLRPLLLIPFDQITRANCSLYPCYVNEANIDKPHLAIFALRDIEPFEEICFSNWGNPNDLEGDN
ncbi:hypothetical protein BDN72DRAFT_920415, partial [Pluteus cervinus]